MYTSPKGAGVTQEHLDQRGQDKLAYRPTEIMDYWTEGEVLHDTDTLLDQPPETGTEGEYQSENGPTEGLAP